MKKTIILSFLFNIALIGQELKPRQLIELNEKIDENKKVTRNLELEISSINGRISAFDSLINTSLQYLQYSGWVGIASACLLLIFSFYATLTVNLDRKKLAEDIKNWKKIMEDDHTIFQAFENSNLKNIISGLDSSEYMVFGDALFRASFLTIDGKQKIVPKIKSKIFDQNYRFFMFDIFSFVNTYTSDKKELIDYYTQLLNMSNFIDLNLSDLKTHIFYALISIPELDKFSILAHIVDKITKSNLTKILLLNLNDDQLINFYNKVILNETEKVNDGVLDEFLIRINGNSAMINYIKEKFELIQNL